MSKKKVKFMSWECDIEKNHYFDGSIALELTHPEDGPIATASVYLENYPIVEPYIKDHCWIKTWSENEGILEALVEAGVVERVDCASVDINGWGSRAIMVKVLI